MIDIANKVKKLKSIQALLAEYNSEYGTEMFLGCFLPKEQSKFENQIKGPIKGRSLEIFNSSVVMHGDKVIKNKLFVFEPSVNEDVVCTCKENDCKDVLCRGKCGCRKCANDYSDFLDNE